VESRAPLNTTNIVDVYINYLRRNMKDPAPGYLIRTVRGKGYIVPSEAELAISLPPALLVSQSGNRHKFRRLKSN